MKKTILAAATVLFLAACGNKQEATSTETTTAPATTEAPAPEPANEMADITISAGDDMKYDITEIYAKEGQKVKITLTHTGKAPVAAMGHNFVLLAAGVNIDEFAKAAAAAKDNDYIPADMAANVIAHTKTIGGGETTEVEFTAPAKGTYDFLCSFPGHYGMMKGQFIVE